MTIHQFVAEGDIASVAEALARGEAIDGYDKDGRTPLMIASASDNADVAMCRLLLDHGANVNALTLPEEPVELNKDVRAMMVEMDMDTSVYDEPRPSPAVDSVLSYAAKTSTREKVIFLLDAGADVGYVDANGYSVLVDALHRPDGGTPAGDAMPIVTAIVEAGAPLDIESDYGESALSVASHRGNFGLVKYFLDRGANPKPLGWTPLFYAVAAGDIDSVAQLVSEGAALESRDRWERTPFLLSVHTGHREIAQFLLERGIDRMQRADAAIRR